MTLWSYCIPNALLTDFTIETAKIIFKSHTAESDLIYLTFRRIHILEICSPERRTPELSEEADAYTYVSDNVRKYRVFQKSLRLYPISRTSRDSISIHWYLLRHVPHYLYCTRVISRSIGWTLLRASEPGFGSKSLPPQRSPYFVIWNLNYLRNCEKLSVVFWQRFRSKLFCWCFKTGLWGCNMSFILMETIMNVISRWARKSNLFSVADVACRTHPNTLSLTFWLTIKILQD
jgi:hypothetical protein